MPSSIESKTPGSPVGERVVAFVPVRLNSSRLPRKHLRMIGSRPVLGWVLDRIKAVREIEDVVVCAPANQLSSNSLREFCHQENVQLFLFSGNENDVVGRLNAAARYYAADICVMVSGDCPLVATDVLANMVRELLMRPRAGWVNLVRADGQPPIHEGMLVARSAVWQRADELSISPEQREHQFPVLWQRPEEFSSWEAAKCADAQCYEVGKVRISIDTGSDLEFMQSVYNDLQERHALFDLKHVLEQLRLKPQRSAINRHVHQRTVSEQPPSVLIVVTAVVRFGYGNLLRSLEIADALVECWGASVRFLVLDTQAQNICEARGFSAKRGEFGVAVVESIGARDDLVIFDVNSGFDLDAKWLVKIKQRAKLVAVIDNVCEVARHADLVVIPTIHHVGPLWPNLYTGIQYVVIRKEIVQLRAVNKNKSNVAAVYPGCVPDEVADRALVDLGSENPGLKSEVFTKPRDGFAEVLAGARFVVAPLSQTLYEGVFLGAIPIVLSQPSLEREEALFLKTQRQLATFAGDGAQKIAALLTSRIQKSQGSCANV